ASWFTPMFLFTSLLVIIAILSFSRAPQVRKWLTVFDRLLFLCTGLMGVVCWALWLGRVDNVCRNNWNTLWALPTHVVIVFVLNKKRPWIRMYWLINCMLLAALLVCWKWLPQEMNNALFPFVALLLLRSALRLKKQ
ncbi:MAG TPA: hypothetical protein VLD19_10665, partial [Chitinophagaceae bacterium]|nr:hypothetical protein [Chitinophagaceae bacterium]